MRDLVLFSAWSPGDGTWVLRLGGLCQPAEPSQSIFIIKILNSLGFEMYFVWEAWTCQSEVWMSENNFQELVLSYYHVGLGDQTQVTIL